MNNRTPENEILLALAHVEELSLKKKSNLLLAMPNPLDWVSNAKRRDLFALLGDENATSFLSKLSLIDDIIKKMQAAEIGWITYLDEQYSDRLREIDAFPPVLFVKGNAELLNSDCITVVGTRTPTRYGAKICDSFVRDFVRAGLTVVSGFARGVDGIAHKVCVDSEAPTIAVFACGLDVCYPAEHKGLMEGILSTGGLIVSEYSLGTKPLQYHFPERNRIVSGLSIGVFLPEATIKSGSLITARLAIEQGKEIFVVPGNINSPESEGCNALLQEIPHAFTIASEYVLDTLGIKICAKEKSVVELSIAETLVTEALHDKELHFEELLDATGMAVNELSTLLMNLELNGIIEQTSGNYYSLA